MPLPQPLPPAITTPSRRLLLQRRLGKKITNLFFQQFLRATAMHQGRKLSGGNRPPPTVYWPIPSTPRQCSATNIFSVPGSRCLPEGRGAPHALTLRARIHGQGPPRLLNRP